MRQSIEERFMSKVDVNGESGCWIWLASRGGGGYGQFGINRVPYGAHRVSMMLFRGVQIRRGREMSIDHLCRNKLCVNPDHLEYVTLKENIRRAVQFRPIDRGRGNKGTACKRGHAFDDVNTYITPRGTRQCRACQRDRELKSLERRFSDRTNRDRSAYCFYGHEMTVENTRWRIDKRRGTKRRECWICRRRARLENQTRRRSQRRGSTLEL